MMTCIRTAPETAAARRLAWAPILRFARLAMAATVAVALAPAPAAWALAPTNAGCVFVLNVESEIPYESGTFDHCGELLLADPSKAVTRLPGDGRPRLVGLYAVFPPDSVGSLRAFNIGIRYSGGVRIWGEAACNAGGLFIGMEGWPASNGGMSVQIMDEGVKKSRVIPLYWFALSAKSAGSFEVIPHPLPKLACRIVGTDFPPVEEAVMGYGRIGVDQDGFVPTPGGRAVLAPCCVGEYGCWNLTKSECEHYHGDFLGYGMTCSNSPCREDAWLGGCCLATGCEMLTLVDCSRQRGTPLGEHVPCEATPCPQSGGTDSLRVPVGKGGPVAPPKK
jgi:hypothetical protein